MKLHEMETGREITPGQLPEGPVTTETLQLPWTAFAACAAVAFALGIITGIVIASV